MHNSIIAFAFVLMLVAPAVAAARSTREIKLRRLRKPRKNRPRAAIAKKQEGRLEDAMLVYAAANRRRMPVSSSAHAVSYGSYGVSLDRPQQVSTDSETAPVNAEEQASAVPVHAHPTGSSLNAAAVSFTSPSAFDSLEAGSGQLEVPLTATSAWADTQPAPAAAQSGPFRYEPTLVQTGGCTWFQVSSAFLAEDPGSLVWGTSAVTRARAPEPPQPPPASYAEPKRNWMETGIREPSFAPFLTAVRERFTARPHSPGPERRSAPRPAPQAASAEPEEQEYYPYSGSDLEYGPEYASQDTAYAVAPPPAPAYGYAPVPCMLPAPYGYPHLMPWAAHRGYPQHYAPYPAQMQPYPAPMPYAMPVQVQMQPYYPMHPYPAQPLYAQPMPAPQPVSAYPPQPGHPPAAYIRKRPARRANS